VSGGTARAPGVHGADISRRRVLMALLFFPRGGSAQVARYLGRELARTGWEVTLLAGSLGSAGDMGHAPTFFEGMDVREVQYAAAPGEHGVPLHPSFEDRPNAPDPVFAAVDDSDYESLVALWEERLEAAGARDADVLHLHHLTPINEAALRSFPELPVVGHVHGTELLMLREIDAGPPPEWTHAGAWAERIRRWARACDRLLVLSPDAVRRVPDVLGVEPDRVAWAPNGFDPQRFDSRPLAAPARRELWERWLVKEPRGWRPGGEAGGVSYRTADLAAFRDDAVVLLYVGRYTEVKRIPLLIGAYARARERFATAAPLVLLGGYPGEWEGAHPADVVAETGARDVFLGGWRGHEDLPDALNAADALVLPSVRESFGQVLVEAMACGLAVVAVDRHGPASIVEEGETGWLVPPDDEAALADALVAVVNDRPERLRRGKEAYRASRGRYAWPALARDVAALYEAVRAGGSRARGTRPARTVEH
jgi:glycosyltransferase involved in cell wall biosynthesis